MWKGRLAREAIRPLIVAERENAGGFLLPIVSACFAKTAGCVATALGFARSPLPSLVLRRSKCSLLISCRAAFVGVLFPEQLAAGPGAAPFSPSLRRRWACAASHAQTRPGMAAGQLPTREVGPTALNWVGGSAPTPNAGEVLTFDGFAKTTNINNFAADSGFGWIDLRQHRGRVHAHRKRARASGRYR